MRGAGQECQDSHLWYGPMELPQPGGVNNLNNINIEPAVQQVKYILHQTASCATFLSTSATINAFTLNKNFLGNLLRCPPLNDWPSCSGACAHTPTQWRRGYTCGGELVLHPGQGRQVLLHVDHIKLLLLAGHRPQTSLL